MARLFEKLFEVDRVVAEGRLGLDPRRFERDWKIGLGASDFHAASAAARRRRYEERKTRAPGRHLLIAIPASEETTNTQRFEEKIGPAWPSGLTRLK